MQLVADARDRWRDDVAFFMQNTDFDCPSSAAVAASLLHGQIGEELREPGVQHLVGKGEAQRAFFAG